MKCINCDCCHKGWFSYAPDKYVCTGVKEPFIIDDVNAECTEYLDKRNAVTIKDAIVHFKYGITHDIFKEPVLSYAKMAVEALEKQDRKHGYWSPLDECSNAGVYCSVCHKKVYREHYANVRPKSKFCPNCGAIMDGEFVKL